MARKFTGSISSDIDVSNMPELSEDDYDDVSSAEKELSTACTSRSFSVIVPADSSSKARSRKRKQASHSPKCCSFRSNKGSIIETTKQRSIVRNAPLALIESLPNEIVQKIATFLISDIDLYNFGLSSPLFPSTIFRAESEVWRKRFLARYDYPRLDGPLEFQTAYKLRRLVLKNFVSQTGDLNRRSYIQMEVLRDLVLETYNNPNPWRGPLRLSRNLKAFESPDSSSWMVTFLSSSFPACTEKKRWGEPEPFFETMQLGLSHLILSPKSAMSHVVTSSRDNYDLVRVYNFDQPSTTLFTCLQETESPTTSLRSSLFPNLKSPETSQPLRRFKLDTTTLLHIRNFWHRHLIDDSHPVGEHTYADMARNLSKVGRCPKKWDTALDGNIRIPIQWMGTYSCLHPWPRARKDLEERQSCAEDWDRVDPMMLDLMTSDDYSQGFWPPAFSTLPLFDNTVPSPPESNSTESPLNINQPKQEATTYTASKAQYFPKNKDPPIYIRGIAPFIKTESSTKPTHNSSSSPPTSAHEARDQYLKTHPYTALRVRGVLHDIPPAATLNNAPDAAAKAIPGWKRIVMILYKPSLPYLINVLEHAAEDFGGTFGTYVTNQLNTATIWSTTNPVTGNSSSVPPQTNTSIPVPANNNNTNTTTTTAPQPLTLSPTTLHLHLQSQLHALLTSPTSPFHPDADMPAYIAGLENTFSAAHYLSWDDIDFAYAYEGVVLPGGKIMLGRWWRCHGLTGAGEGWEVDGEGEGVDLDEEETEDGDGNGNGNGNTRQRRELDRGPFVFWA